MRNTLFFILIVYSTTIMASSIEKQKYRLVQAEKEFEIRYYPSATLATVYSTANSYRQISTPGFRKLAGFIFGGNETNTKISMTSPVHMDINDDKSTMSFVMPSKYEDQNLPAPNDSRVKLEKSKAEYVAVLRFRGYASDEKISRHSDKLKSSLDDQGITYSGNFRFLGYNPPYQFIGRKNEIIVSVDWLEDKETK
ncbi:heme-binding protein [Bacteroidota bacterium]